MRCTVEDGSIFSKMGWMGGWGREQTNHEGTRISTNSEEGGGWSIIIQFLPTDGIFDISLVGIILYLKLDVK